MSKFLNRIAPQDEVLLETDIGTMIPSAEQLAEERVTRFNADKEIRLRVKALEESGSAIEEAKAAVEQAKQAAQQAEDAKDAIGDVGGRLDAVETSVAEKVPFVSRLLELEYRVVRGGFNMGRVEYLTRLHEGFLMRDSYSTAKDRLLIPATNQVIQVDCVGTVRLSVIETDKTTIYSYNGSTLYKTTVSGSGEGLTFLRETITAMPTAVEALSGVVGYKTANGYVVCTQGHILSADLETEVATFYAVTSYQYILKNGESFYFYDGAVKKLATLTLAEDGAPSIAYNNYVQTNGRYFPHNATLHVKSNDYGLYVGATRGGIGYLYRESAIKDWLMFVGRLKNYPLLFFPSRIVMLRLEETNIKSSNLIEVARDLIADNATAFYGNLYNGCCSDARGNIIYAFTVWSGVRESNKYNLLIKK